MDVRISRQRQRSFRRRATSFTATHRCVFLYLLMAERGNMIVTHVFEQMAGLGGNVAAGIIHGGAMQMAGNVTGGLPR